MLQFARPQAGMIALGFGLTLLGTTAALAPPYIAIPLIDQVLLPAWKNPGSFNSSLFIRCMVGMLLAAILAWLLRWARTYILAGVSERVAANVRNVTYAHLQQLSLEFFGGKRTGDLMSRIGTDTDRINNYLTLHLLDFGTDLLMILLTTLILLSINPWLALATLTPIPAIGWLMHLVRKRLRHGFGRGARAWGEMVSVLADTIPGVRVVKAFAQEGREVERFRGANQLVLHANDGVNRVWSFFDPMVGLLTDLGNLVIWLAGAWFVIQGWATVGALQAFLVYIGRFYGRLDAMSRMMTNTQRAGSAANRIFEILDRVPSVAEPVKPIHPGRVEGRIELRDVKFQYGTRQVIKGVSLAISPGEMIGLVGPSGAGKSTLVNLVCRFYDVMSGSILVDGVDIRSFPLAEYRRNIGIVLQEPFLFFGTVADNIAYARPEASRAQIIEAARAANAHDFILRLPDGYDSLVGERGQSLSGGERQRLSIARALLTDPKILILDEATSSVDTQTEREIQGALDALTRGRTTIAIAHRLSTLRSANRLIVMEDGQIVEMGNHDELIERAGAYFRLHQAQHDSAEEVVVTPPL
jgi:ATP-binding cassette subfamily B protein